MSLSSQLSTELKRLNGHAGPKIATIGLNADDGVVVSVDVSAADVMSCAVREIRVNVPALVDAGFDALKTWAESLSKRITYLLENIGPLELDEDSGQILIRSRQPNDQDGAKQFYEILLQSSANGNFTLRRYESRKGAPARTQVDFHLTHEVLKKLAIDLVETIPA